MGEIADARARYKQRKLAVAGFDDGDAAIRALMSGFDLDLAELREQSAEVAKMAQVAVHLGAPLDGAIGAAYGEGLGSGLLLAEARRKGEES